MNQRGSELERRKGSEKLKGSQGAENRWIKAEVCIFMGKIHNHPFTSPVSPSDPQIPVARHKTGDSHVKTE